MWLLRIRRTFSYRATEGGWPTCTGMRGTRPLQRTGDIYQLFYERGMQLMRPGQSLLAYITSNSWLKADYGKSTRRWLSENHTPLLLLELGKDVFEAAIVDSCIYIARNGKSEQVGRAVDLDRLADKSFPPAENLWGGLRCDSEKPWAALSTVERSVMDKMETEGTPLKEWGLSIFRGVTTGYNQAFIIDGATKEALVTADSKSAEIIKPVLRGRDIRRYRANSPGLWLIYVPWHFPLQSDSSINGASGKAEQLFEEQFPGVYKHLLAHKTRLSARNKAETGIRYEWYALQRWAAHYYQEFSKEKLFWMDMSPEGRFAYLETETYCNNKGFLMTGESLKYLCGVLNSSPTTWYMRNSARTTGMGLIQWEKFVVETIPIPKIKDGEQKPLVELVEEILAVKDRDVQTDTEDLEREIDRIVYELYGLTEQEITAIERSLVPNHATEKEESVAVYGEVQ